MAASGFLERSRGVGPVQRLRASEPQRPVGPALDDTTGGRNVPLGCGLRSRAYPRRRRPRPGEVRDDLDVSYVVRLAIRKAGG